ncbi:tetratricopeptide repeat protein [bacterium]|nr:MAG: tetratricopeptide repeat protein [bacterium]
MADYIDDDNLWKEDLFATLDVNPDASDAELKKSYLKLAKKYHPDKFPEDNQEKFDAQRLFSKITVAYNTLIDPLKRSHYLDLRRLLASHLPENQQASTPNSGSAATSSTSSSSSPVNNPPKEDKPADDSPSPDMMREQQARALYDLAIAQMKKKKVDKAIEYLKQAISLKSGISEFHSQLGLAYKEKNWESMAQAEYKIAIKLNPRDKVALANVKGAADKTKKPEEKKGGLFSSLFNFGKKK